eukprot:15364348-Ditylum_brightwellii.AAC.1
MTIRDSECYIKIRFDVSKTRTGAEIPLGVSAQLGGLHCDIKCQKFNVVVPVSDLSAVALDAHSQNKIQSASIVSAHGRKTAAFSNHREKVCHDMHL